MDVSEYIQSLRAAHRRTVEVDDDGWNTWTSVYCSECDEDWPCPTTQLLDHFERGTAADRRIEELEAVLWAIRAVVVPVKTRRVRRNGTILALIDSVLPPPSSISIAEVPANDTGNN